MRQCRPRSCCRWHGNCQALLRRWCDCAADERLTTVASDIDGERDAYIASAPLQPYEEVRDFFYLRHNCLALLDALFERLQQGAKPAPGQRVRPGTDVPVEKDLASLLDRYLADRHDVEVVQIRAFQLATQVARLEAAEPIEEFARADAFKPGSKGACAHRLLQLLCWRAGSAYRRFLAEAEALRYDIDLLSQRFGVSFETVCHRLSTMQRPDARGIPFFFVRVDRAGNVS